MHHHITEDTPPDMLAGAMDLVVRLPDGRDVNMAVERSTPMMDLLVHLTTANKLKPSDHLLQALDMSTDRTLPYKPNTPIGALDTQRVRVYPKGSAKGLAPRVPVGQQPFESTFRLQVHLPRNQFCVIRVGKYVLLEDIMKKVCEEKNLDPKKFEFRHPANIDKVLDPKRTLNDYEITEITVVHRGTSGHLSQALSSTDIMALQREDERRKMQAKTGGGVLNLIFKRGRNSMGSGSISSDTRSISPTQSDDSRSVTPPAIPQTIQPPVLKSPTKESVQVQIQNQNRPKPPLRKRRPAPKPPAITQSKSLPEIISGRPEVPKNLKLDTVQQEEEEEIPASQKSENGLTICHSRNSSDSSGYHEASILSDNCNTTLPRRPKSIGINSSNSNISMEQKCDFRKSTGNLANMAVQSKSTISLTTAGRKKKAPPPPPSLSSAYSAASITSSISSPPNSDIAHDVNVVNASSIKRVVELPKSNSNSDNETASLTMVPKPKPKPRTIKTPVPVPTPRKVFTEPQQQQQQQNNIVDNEVDDKVVVLDDEIVEENVSLLDEDNKSIATTASTPVHKQSKFESLGRTSGFQIGQSMLSIDDDSSENMRRNISSSTLNSSSSSSHHPEPNEPEDAFNNIQIENIDIFESNNNKHIMKKKKKKHLHKTENLMEIHDLRHNKTFEEFLSKSPSNSSIDIPVNDSLLSLRSVTSLPGFLDNEAKIRKWENLQSLDVSIGDDRNSSSHHWVVGDPSDADSTAPATPNDTHSLPRTSTVSLTSTKSNTETASLHSSFNEDSKVPSSSQEERRISEKIEQIKTNTIQEEEKESSKKETKKMSETHSSSQETPDELDAEWQYTLPSPPTAFRDASPTNFTDVTNYDTVTFNGLTTDSIVTSPALFEKLESISHTRSEVQQEDTISNASSIKNNKPEITENAEATKHVKEEPPTVPEIKQEEVLTSKYLSLETLEKRKSLVLERELASLKNAQNAQNETAATSATEQSTTTIRSQRDSLKNEIEEVLQNRSRSATLSRTNSQSREKLLLMSAADSSALPNFKITTYDQPKSKINIFEDDSIRSSNIDKQQAPKTTIQSIQSEDMDILRRKSNSSSENVYFAKRNSMDDFMFKKPELPPKFNKKSSGVVESIENQNASDAASAVSRSESFSMQKQKHIWNRTSPVKRSKSHISLDKYNKEEPLNHEESLHKSNSLYNVSGLQSLEVMRMILPKLGNTPPSSPSEDKQVNPLDDEKEMAPPPFIPVKPELPKEPSQSTKKYQYSGPPAINFASWSERPKTQVSIKEDTDYKFNNIKAKFNGSQENGTVKTQSYPSVNIRVNSSNSKDQVDSGKINIKINGDEPTKTISQQQSGNVVIKIGSNNNNNNKNGEDEKVQKNSLYTRFLNQTTAVGYRKPLGNINGVDKPRPHSIAFDASCPDLSRVPIVRAVELKKPFKETPGNNKSITQILHDTSYQTEDTAAVNSNQDKSMSLGNQYRHSSVYLSNENINKIEQNGGNKVLSVFSSKPIARGNSFANSRINGNISNVNPVVKGFRDNNNDQKKVFSFNNNNSNNISNINNSKSIENSNFVPFSQHTLRRTQDSPQKQISQTERNIFETVTLRKTATTANRHSLPATATVEIKNPQQVSAPPPPPPKLPKTFALTNKKPIQRQLPVEDPRDQLLESIRNFGGKSGLKTVK